VKQQNFVLGAVISVFVLLTGARPVTLIQRVPGKAATRSNPFEGQKRAKLTGAKLFARECAACHGTDGAGNGRTPPLNQADVQEAAPGILFWILRNGSLKRGMPSFAHLPEAQRWQIVTYVKTLGRH
jgi:mono/diheme cytochrome c family protein